ncbi:MAG: hypothetical protein GY906_03810 [bacterium]|nr:hypothetical protein [bacterium]
MSKVQEYLILLGDGVEELSKLVNEKLVEGWSTLKGPFVFGESICQAMVLKARKKKDEEKEPLIKVKGDRIRKTSDDGIV